MISKGKNLDSLEEEKEMEFCKTIEGLDKPDYSKEQHYFIVTRSLCGKWALFSSKLQKKPLKAFPICTKCMEKSNG